MLLTSTAAGAGAGAGADADAGDVKSTNGGSSVPIGGPGIGGTGFHESAG